MAIIDLLANCIICMLVGVMIGVYGYRTICALLSGLIFMVILANLLLLAGIGGSCGFLIGFWQVIMILYIVLLIVGWIALPFIVAIDYYPLVVKEPEKLDVDIEIEMTPLNHIYWGVIMLTVLILPIYYTYYWIVVNSYRKNILSRRHRFTPGVAGKSDNAFVIRHPPPPYQPHMYGHSPNEHGQLPITASQPPNLYGEHPPPFRHDVVISQPPPQWALYDIQETNEITCPKGTSAI